MRRVKRSAIEWMTRFRRDPCPLFIVCIAVLGTVHLLVRTATHGLAVYEDSINFLSTARNFLAGAGWRDLWGDPLVGWPPLFPLLLAAGGWVGVEPLAAGRWVHAAAFGLTILAAGRWLRSHLRSQWLAVAASAAIAASLPLNLFASKISTDFLFAVLTLFALMQLASFLHRGGRRPLLWGAVFTALAAITRYPGVVLIGAGVLMLLGRRAPSRAVRLKDSIVFGIVSSLPLAGVLTRNWASSGNWTGREEQSGQSLSAGLSQTVDMFRGWVINPRAPDELELLVWTVAGLLVAVGVVVVVSGRGLGLGLGGHTGEARPAALFGLGPALPFGVFALAYSAFLVVVVPFTVGQGIDHRYLLPVYVPLLLVAVVLLDGFLSIPVAGRLVAVRFVLASLVLLAFLARTGFSAYWNLRVTDEVYVTGFRGAFNSSDWEPSATLNYIMSHPREGKIYTNCAGPSLPWFGDRLPALGKYRRLPRVGIHKLTSHIMRQTAGEGAHIVWRYHPLSFYDYDYNYLDLRVLLGVDTVAELSDGVVFRVTAAEPFDGARHRARKQRYVEDLIQQASERVVRAGWEVYRTGRKLIYRKESCAPADVQAMFVLHVIPVDPADLPARRPKQYSFENRDFFFEWHGFRRGGQCMAIAHLPAYPIGRIYIGQWIAKDNRTLWDADMEMHRAQKQRYIDHLIQQASERVVRAGWAVYRTGRMLIYRKEPCAPADVQATFVLHVIPVDPADLPADRQQYSSDNRDFYFNWDSYFDWDAFDWDARRQSSSFRLGDQCIAVAHLPAYPIDRIYIGQWIAAEDRTLWDAEFALSR